MTFFVAGTPKATPRVKACRFGQGSRVYTPKTADEWKYCVQQAALKEIDLRGSFQKGPLELLTTFYLERPKSHFNKKGLKPTAPMWCETKPDFDNAVKAVSDALTNAGIWRDDSQVARAVIELLYVTENNPLRCVRGCRITITELD